MAFEVEYTDEFEEWWKSLDESEQISIAATVGLLEDYGTSLQHPHSSGIKGSRYSRMRELRIQHKGNPYRVLYAFDPKRVALLLIGGDKTGNDNWYDEFVPIADGLYEKHLEELEEEES